MAEPRLVPESSQSYEKLADHPDHYYGKPKGSYIGNSN